ncbi:MAG: Tol-Pal system beta propeller repeat protein TolB [Candidatus Rokubacteria bacterium]|nr:Tol-Pal system beta propeller repeat protein TolB [Candidatus Rokubacteria bacterium]
MSKTRLLAVPIVVTLIAAIAGAPSGPPPARSQGADVLLNVLAGGAKRLNIAIPTFTLAGGADPQGLARQLAEVTGNDLRFSALFSPVVGAPPLPANPEAAKRAWADFTAAGAHAGLHGVLTVRGDRVQVDATLYDLTAGEPRTIGTKRLELWTVEWRRLAHRIADEVVLQFTGEPGVADTKIAYVNGGPGAKEVFLMDYDGVGVSRLTATKSINISPSWSPDTRSVAFTSYMGGYPYLYRLFPFERRPVQLLAGFLGINTSPAWSPDGRAVALTLSKDGNPEIYLLTVATGAFRRLTTHPAIDTEPTWSPTGRQIAFVSDRTGPAQIFVMDAEGVNVRQITSSGFNTQPRWSPKGDAIAYTSRQGSHEIWVVAPDGSNPRPLTSGGGDAQSSSWAPNGRHLVFQAARGGKVQLYTMLVDGSEQQALPRTSGESSSPSWSPRLP